MILLLEKSILAPDAYKRGYNASLGELDGLGGAGTSIDGFVIIVVCQ
jgi:hypothetical protein